MSIPPSSPTVLTGQVSQRLSFQDVIDKNAEQWAALDTDKRREVADAFFDDQVIPSQADKWGSLGPIKQEETRRAFHQDYGIESLPDLRFDGMGPMQTQASTLQAQLVNQARQHPIISDVLQTPQSYVQGGIEGLTARGARFNSPLPTGPISNFARSAGNTVGGIAGRLGLGYGLTPFLGPAGAGAASMGIYGGAENINTQIDDYHRDMKTINYPELGATTAINAVAGALPAAATGSLVKRALTGAGMNIPFGIGDMAAQDYFEGRQMDPGSYAQQLIMDAITGGGLGALLGKRGGTPRRGSPISLKQVNEQPTVLQGRVEERVPISEGWKFKPTKTERQVLKRMDPTRRKRLDKAMTKRAEMEMQRANMRASENPVSYEQMLQDMADEVLARPTEQRKVLIAQHRKKVKRVAKRQLRDPNAEPSPDEQFSMDLVDAIDKTIARHKGSNRKQLEHVTDPGDLNVLVASVREMRAKGNTKQADVEMGQFTRETRAKVYDEVKRQEAAEKKKKASNVNIHQKKIEEAQSRTAQQEQKTESAKRVAELKALREDIQQRTKNQVKLEKELQTIQDLKTRENIQARIRMEKEVGEQRQRELASLKADIQQRSKAEAEILIEEQKLQKAKDAAYTKQITEKYNRLLREQKEALAQQQNRQVELNKTTNLKQKQSIKNQIAFEQAESKKRDAELRVLKADIQQRAQQEQEAQKKETILKGRVGAARTKQAVSKLAPDKQTQTARNEELKTLREEIQSRNNSLYVPLTKKSYQYIKGKDGNITLTTLAKDVAKALGLEPLAVRLQYGYHKPKAQSNRGEGFGLVHIEAGHGKDIREQGFKDAAEFVEYVLKNYNEVYTQEKGRPIFVVRNGRSKYAVVELQKTHDGFYSVTTAFPEAPKYIQDGVKGRKLVWSGRNSQSQVEQPRSAEPATVSKTSDQVGYGARAQTSKTKNNKSTTTPQASKQLIPQSRHEGQPQKAENPGKLTEVRQKTSNYETLDSLFEYEDAYNAYRELPKEQKQAVETINEQMKRGERLEIFGYDPKTGELTSGTGRKEGLGGDPNKLVTPLGWNYNSNTGEIKFVALNNNFEVRQYIIPKKTGSFGANAVLPSKQKGVVGGENNVYYKPGTFADPGEYVDHAIKKLPLVDIADLYDGKVTPQTEARLRNILNLKDSRVEVYNHVREIMTNQDAFKQYVLDHYLKDSPLVAHLENSTFSKPVDTAKAGALLSRNDIKIRRVIQMVAGCK